MVYDAVPNPPKKTVKKRRPKLMAVVNESCTGCEACVDFCPVDCIDHVSPAGYTGAVLPPVRIRYDECIGCQVCAKVCEHMAWNAIDMIPIEEFERRFDMKITDGPPPMISERVMVGSGVAG